ncbi:MAG TPA: aminopeptidase [Thermotogota bacterium]|nr:aminopeptidase [Thermotogota bacterium]HPR96784.1 aminopeptidase [Thermotogota bacterium]
MSEKNKFEEIRDNLRMKKKSVWSFRDPELVFKFSDEYKTYLKTSTTERRSITEAIAMAEAAGYIDYEAFLKNPPEKLDGVKIYQNNRGKSAGFYHFTSDLSDGLNIVAAHVDVPRIDFKPNPFYEDSEFAMIHTHYYGGIKKYQWFNIPLAIDGVVIKNDGEKINVRVGFDADDPVFVITDLLPHLDRRTGSVNEVFTAQTLNLIMGSRAISYKKEEKVDEPVVLNILQLLNDKYGITEEDFFSAEIEIVPAIEPKDVGLDRSMLGGYGHDDRVCTYTGLRALLDAEKLEKSGCVLLLDKEEIGSEGNTGAQCYFWKKVLKRVAEIYKAAASYEEIVEKTMLLSGDVTAAYNPSFKEVHEEKNAAKLGYGIAFAKYTGVRGKGGANDAHAEILGDIRKIFNDRNVFWQSGELGKVDQGGGGTVAKYFSSEGMAVVDAGVPVLGMHSPYEIVSKADVYETYYAYKVFFEEMK